MASAVHKGLIVALKNEMQLAGIQVDDITATSLLLGAPVFATKSPVNKLAGDLAFNLFANRHEHMKSWEEAHPGQSPYPDPFPRVVLAKLQAIDAEDPTPTIIELIKLAESELA